MPAADSNSNNGFIGTVEKKNNSTMAKCSANRMLLGHRRVGGTYLHRAKLNLPALSRKWSEKS